MANEDYKVIYGKGEHNENWIGKGDAKLGVVDAVNELNAMSTELTQLRKQLADLRGEVKACSCPHPAQHRRISGTVFSCTLCGVDLLTQPSALTEARTTPKPAAEVVEANGWEDHDLFGLCTKTIEAVIGEIVKEVRLHGDERNSNVRSCKYQEAVYSRERENACIGVNQRLRSLISTIESGRRSIEALAAQSAKEKP